MTTPVAADDIVGTRHEAAGNGREPLVVVEPLLAFLDEHGLGSGDAEFEPIGDGHSNVTYLVTRGDWEFVLRRPPRGPLPPSAHNVLREARVLQAVDGHARVPKVLAVGSDERVIGAPFYLMERVAGHVVTTEVPPEVDTIEDRQRMGESLIDALVEVHAVDWQTVGLDGYGKPTGYCERQVRRFTGLWTHNRTREIPHIGKVGRWLIQNLPDSPPATIVHGDFRLGNVIVGTRPPARVVAILDWEMSTIGDPLADLGYLCTHWVSRDDPSLGMFELSPVTREPGYLSAQALISRYEQRSGRPVRDICWYQTLALWKSAILMEGNYKRATAGATDDPYLKSFGDSVIMLAQRAEEIARSA